MNSTHFFLGSFKRAVSVGVCLVSIGIARGQNSQSPIDISSDALKFDPSLPSLGFSYGTTDLSVVNNGSPGVESTIRANVPAGAGTLSLSGVSYNLVQFHFHTESEHSINGVASAMELHMVHQDAGGNYLVVGRLIEPGAENSALVPLFSNLPPSGSSPTLPIFNFDLGALLPTTLTSYRYDGSLTTSPYTEPVKWVVMSETMELSQGQIDDFRGLFDGPEGNHREPQPLNGRIIATDVPEPSAVALMALGFGLILAKRRKSVLHSS